MDKFWNKVNKTDSCWEWQGSKDRDGYGRYKSNGKLWQAHRYSVLLDGKDPKGMVVMHSCDNPSCVRPDHLQLGTQADNIKDMIAKGRYVKPQSKLSKEDIKMIQDSTDSYTVIGKRFNISAPYVCSIKQKVKVNE
jgi:hypothetical protein